MNSVTHRLVQAGDVRLHIAEAGTGPLVLLLHGFPEAWYSWRHQINALAEAGFRAVAVDQRGYGQSEHPTAVEKYSIMHLVGDVIHLLHALDEKAAVVVGHDWGAEVAWHTALMRPDLVRGVVGMSLPYRPRGAQSQLADMVEAFGDGVYTNYFQRPGAADADLGADPRKTFRLMLRGARKSAQPRAHSRPPAPIVPAGRTYLDIYSEPANLPAWLTEADIEAYAAEFSAGFSGALNWYRNMDRNWELTAFLHNGVIRCPALYLVGQQDRCLNFPGVRDAIERLDELVVGRSEAVVLPDVGHWTQQEAPEQVSTALIEFARSVAPIAYEPAR
ncbi:alpha/beta fold hydrolase [Saccharopolyspora phatthalungensis]|uniref:Pimeloyl-ACP methyl ester carboxylesterase n=1 Tax=Saccharopolyspora phatthalungensis TaxID=664693 RepID=A0A840QGD9_9PSEU|nr:alpha/beta hydrolase [Saccharopolyspora phatthalungensis]MBB5159020.1 pimeloyl-ACP methyl ester carboxylesterase [Saccharopolyspora phatthalungensis]